MTLEDDKFAKAKEYAARKFNAASGEINREAQSSLIQARAQLGGRYCRCKLCYKDGRKAQAARK